MNPFILEPYKSKELFCDRGSGAAVSKNVKSLIEKELVLAENGEEGVQYSVYNVFLSRYLEKA
ncbi:MAG: hypothetical protein ACI4AE_01510 [Candidatus Cryptobacteroides sp.]